MTSPCFAARRCKYRATPHTRNLAAAAPAGLYAWRQFLLLSSIPSRITQQPQPPLLVDSVPGFFVGDSMLVHLRYCQRLEGRPAALVARFVNAWRAEGRQRPAHTFSLLPRAASSSQRGAAGRRRRWRAGCSQFDWLVRPRLRPQHGEHMVHHIESCSPLHTGQRPSALINKANDHRHTGQRPSAINRPTTIGTHPDAAAFVASESWQAPFDRCDAHPPCRSL